MSGSKCDVCDAPSIGVASSALGPVSFAYCGECAAIGAEPYSFTVGLVAMNGGTPDAVAPWFFTVIDATRERSGKTDAEFWADVAEVVKQEGGAR